MIIVQDILQGIVNELPTIDLKDNRNQFPVFGWGVKDELNRFLDKEDNKAYPLIWLLPASNKYGVQQVKRQTELIFAVNFAKDTEDWDNKDRLDYTFKTILFPLLDLFLKKVAKSHNMDYDNTDFDVMEYPNYVISSEDNDVIDLWDALTLNIDAIYFNNC